MKILKLMTTVAIFAGVALASPVFAADKGLVGVAMQLATLRRPRVMRGAPCEREVTAMLLAPYLDQLDGLLRYGDSGDPALRYVDAPAPADAPARWMPEQPA